MLKESAAAPIQSLQVRASDGFPPVFAQACTNEPLCTFVPLGGNRAWLAALPVQDVPGGNRALSSVLVRAEAAAAEQPQLLGQPLAAFSVTRRCQRSWKWRKDGLSMSCCRCQGSRQDGRAAPTSPAHVEKARVCSSGSRSALPGCHEDTAGLPGIYSWTNPSPNPAAGRAASD